MVYDLSTLSSAMEGEFIAWDSMSRCKFLRFPDEHRRNFLCIFRKCEHGFDVFLGDEEKVSRGFGMDILKCNHFGILMHNGRGEFLSNDAAEEAVGHRANRMLVDRAGLEPATKRLRVSCSTN